MAQRYTKDPDDVIDFKIDWARHLAAIGDGTDTIDTSSWSIETDGSGMTIEDDTQFTDTTATVWLSGGANDGRVYYVRNRIVTVGGRTLDAAIAIQTQSRR